METEETKQTERKETKANNSVLWDLLNNLRKSEVNYESPVNLNISKMKEMRLPELVWHHYSVVPRKVKLANNGNTVILCAKFFQERPYISGGPLLGNYVFSQIHFHWGSNDMEGSEHMADGIQYPVEMHVVLFKSTYLTQEAALTEKDGIVVLAYFFKLQSQSNHTFEELLETFGKIQKANTAIKLTAFPLNLLIHSFKSDYFIYWGNINTSVQSHLVTWIICREPIGMSAEQTEKFRIFHNEEDEPLLRTFRIIKTEDNKQIYHVNPSPSKFSTLLPISYDVQTERKHRYSKRQSKVPK